MKKYMRIISVVMAVVICIGLAAPAFAAEVNRRVCFDNGKLKIMHITDSHLSDDNVDESVWLIGMACDKEEPDIAVITGDNVHAGDGADKTKERIDKLMTVFETRNIPVAIAFGNHDSETDDMTREELMAYYNRYSCSVSVDDGDMLSGCGTYNVPVYSSNGDNIKFNLWIFDSGHKEHYSCVKKDQVEWYKEKSEELKAANGGEKVNSLVFQHIIVAEIYDVLKKTDSQAPFSFEHMYNEGEYYMFDPENKNYGTLNETPCSGYENFGQFDAMVEKGDVLAMFTGHDHSNAFGVRNQGIDIVNSLSTRYNGDVYSTQYGYRMIEVDESDTSVYSTRVVRWYDFFAFDDIVSVMKSKDSFAIETTLKVTLSGFIEKAILTAYRSLTEVFTGRQITYAD